MNTATTLSPASTVLVFPTRDSITHWTTERLLAKGGWTIGEFAAALPCDEGNVLHTISQHPEWTGVVGFGETALRTLLQRQDIYRWFGRVGELQVGTPSRSMPVVLCFEPRLLLPYTVKKESALGGPSSGRGMRHPPRYQGMAVGAIRKGIQWSHQGWQDRPPTTYLQDPTPQRFGQWVDEWQEWVTHHPSTYLSWDIETPYKLDEDDEEEYEEASRQREKSILRISFAYRPHQAVSVPWLPEYMGGIRQLLAWEGDHVGWNAVQFDIPVVESNGVVVNGRMFDGMDCFHLLHPDLDKGLEHVTSYFTRLEPWKHLSDTLPALYSCIDADAALQNLLGSQAALTERGLWDRAVKEMEILQVLKRAGERGNHVDEAFRQTMKAELETILGTQLVEAQPMVPPALHQHKMYSRLPKSADPAHWASVQQTKTVQQCSNCAKHPVSTAHKCPMEILGPWKKQPLVVPAEKWYVRHPLEGKTELGDILDALASDGFNPCSANQMKRYMKAHRHPVGTNFKTKQETADVKHIQKLVKSYGDNHPLYKHTLHIRQVQKALSTYVNGMAPDPQGLIHTAYVNSTNTWRLGSRHVNVQNLGKRNTNPYAKKARKIIIPRPGHVFVQADSSAIEAVMVGWFMGDDKYIRLARKGIHGYVTAKKLGWDVTPDTWTAEMNEAIKNQHKDEYNKYKMVNHASNYGMSPYLLHMSDPDTFPTLRSAQAVQDFIFQTLPTLPEWHHQLRLAAKKNGYLDNPWGLRFYFYDVFTYKYDEDHRLIMDGQGRPQVTLGKDAKRVIAVKPQSSAGMFMRDNLWELGRTRLAPYLPAIVSIHDGYTVEVPDEPSWVDYAVETLGDILCRPIPEMGGLQVGAEISLMRENFLNETVVKVIEV